VEMDTDPSRPPENMAVPANGLVAARGNSWPRPRGPIPRPRLPQYQQMYNNGGGQQVYGEPRIIPTNPVFPQQHRQIGAVQPSYRPPGQPPHHRQLGTMSPDQASTRELWRRACINKSLLNVTPEPLANITSSPGLDTTQGMVQPPGLNYSPQFDNYPALDDEFTRLETTASPYNYNPAEMTFCKGYNKRMMDTSAGSSFNRPQVKRGRMEDQVERDAGLDVSGHSGVAPLNLSCDGETGVSMDKTWRPTRFYHDEYDDEEPIWCTSDGSIAHEHEEVSYSPPNDSFEDQRQSRSANPLCKSCPPDDVPATVTGWCDQCSEYLCQECIAAHGRVSLTRSHSISYVKVPG